MAMLPVIPGITLGRRLSEPGQREVWAARIEPNATDPDDLIAYRGYRCAVKWIERPDGNQRACLQRDHDLRKRLVSVQVAQSYVAHTDQGPAWVAGELVRGRTLRRWAPLGSSQKRRKKLSKQVRLRRFLRVAIGIVQGAVDMHSQGVVHRDLTPSNFKADRWGQVKLLDFEIARVDDEDRAGHARGVTPPEVQTGTLGWMAPERCVDRQLSFEEEQASEVFSLALVLIFLWTGQDPVPDAEDAGEAQRRINIGEAWTDDPVVQDVPTELRDILEYARSHRADERPTALDILEVLENLSTRGAATRPNWWRTRAAAYSGGSALAVTALVVATAIIPKLDPDPPPPQPSDPRCAVGVANAAPSRADGTLRLSALLPRSGPLFRPAQIEAMRLAADEIRRGGAVPGLQIDDVPDSRILDDREASLCAFTGRLLGEGVDVIVGPGSSAAALNMIDAVTGAGVLLVSPSATSPELTDYPDEGLFVRTPASDVLQARVLTDQIVADGVRTAVVLNRGDSYGSGFATVLADTLRQAGVAVPLVRAYDPPTTDDNPQPSDYTALTQQIKGIDPAPNAIIMVSFETDSAAILASLIRGGVTLPNTRFYGAESNMVPKMPLLVNDELSNDVVNSAVIAGMRGTTILPVNDVRFAEFERALEGAYGGALDDLRFAAETFDAVIVAALAANLAKSDRAENIGQQVVNVTSSGMQCETYVACLDLIKQGKDIDYAGISGPLDLTVTGEPCRVSYPILEFGSDGILREIRRVDAANFCIDDRGPPAPP